MHNKGGQSVAKLHNLRPAVRIISRLLNCSSVMREIIFAILGGACGLDRRHAEPFRGPTDVEADSVAFVE